jgi:hypothetical protein
MSLYQSLLRQPADTDILGWFQKHELPQGYALLDKIECSKKDKCVAAKYVAKAYDPASEIHDRQDSRLQQKIDILKGLGVDPSKDFWLGIIQNKNEACNQYINWYFNHVVQDDLWEAIQRVKDRIADQYAISGAHVEKGDLGEDKFLRAKELQHTQLMNALALRKELQALVREYQTNNEKAEASAESDRIRQNSGWAERGADIAKEFKQNGKP